jgi:HlyD family secretion protein
MKKSIKIVIGVGIAGILVLLAFAMQSAPPHADVATVDQRDFIVSVEDQGRTRARDPFIVAAPISGSLLRSDLNEGDRVTQGQVIARIALSPQDSRTVAIESANLAASEATLRAEQALLLEAQGFHSRSLRELDRREELLKNRLISVEEIDTYRQALIGAQSRVESSEASVSAARANTDSVKSRLLGAGVDLASGNMAIENVVAPTSGTVLKVLEESERVVQAGSPLLVISNQDAIEVVVDLLTQDAVRVETGDPVSIDGWGGDFTIDGVVRYVEPEAFTKFSALGVEEQRVNVVIDLQNAPLNLGAEYRVEVSINVLEFSNVLTVPASALFQRANAWSVFAVEEQFVVLRQIEIGNRNREFARVTSGLSAGDQVILYPSDLIEEGVEVTVD